MCFKQITAAALTLAVLMSLSSTSVAQEQTRFVIKVNGERVFKLRDEGSLAYGVEAAYRQRISLIDVQFEGTENLPPNLVEADVEVSNSVANVILDERLIEQIRKAPVRIVVPQDKRNFSSLTLVYARGANENRPIAPVEPILNSSGQPIDMYFIRLKDANAMAGGIDGFDRFEIETKFGKVSMPMDQVAGIKFHIDGKDSAVVVLDNGDTVTGVPTIPAVKLQTDWGRADIEPEYMNALTTTGNARFVQESTDFGLRWELRTGDAIAPGR